MISALEAEAACDRQVEKAKEERDRFIEVNLPQLRMAVSDRVRKAAEARFAGKVEAAERECDRVCEDAQEELFKALGD